jgi:hypothetical protein
VLDPVCSNGVCTWSVRQTCPGGCNICVANPIGAACNPNDSSCASQGECAGCDFTNGRCVGFNNFCPDDEFCWFESGRWSCRPFD